jgi:hypothetical protein
MTFDDFKRDVEAAGLQPHDCGHGHWQIKGGALLVNVYPFTAKGIKVYLAGTVRGRLVSGFGDAILLAISPRGVEGPRAKRRPSYRAVKRRMLARSNKCHWCKCVLTAPTATLDHLVPLSKGGLDNPNNWVLACEPCNTKRGSQMPT